VYVLCCFVRCRCCFLVECVVFVNTATGHTPNCRYIYIYIFCFSFLILERVGLLGRVISLSQGCYLHRITQTQNKHKHSYLEWDSNP
jgi:hypothetical protein